MAKANRVMKGGKHAEDLKLEREQAEREVKRRLKAQRKFERRQAEAAAATALCESTPMAVEGQRSKNGKLAQWLGSRALAKRRTIDKASGRALLVSKGRLAGKATRGSPGRPRRKPNKMMLKMKKKAARRNAMDT